MISRHSHAISTLIEATENSMKQNVKIAVAAGAVALVGGIVVAGTSLAQGGFGHGGQMGMMHGLGHEMLQKLDTNADGGLSQEEIDAGVNARLTQFDANKDGKLALAEFEALWADLTRPVAVRAFQFLDPDGDAAITKQELNDRFGRAVARFDRNDDGVLSRDDRGHRRGWRHGRGGDDDRGE
jgi:hypothetical protein